MVLGFLEDKLGIEFSPDITIRNVNLINIEGGDKFQKNGQTLNLNLHELDPEERRKLLDLPKHQFETDGRVLREVEAKEVTAMESGYSSDMDEILEYFEGILTGNYLDIIERGLHLRALISEKDLSREEIRSKKRDIARRHGFEAMYLSSLTTAGYFNPDGGLRDLYVDMGLNDNYDRMNFQKELERLVENELICVFVEHGDNILDTTNEVRGRLSRYQKLDPILDWIDIRGIGPGCKEIIDSVVENLKEEFIGLDCDRWESPNGATVVRIYPQSLPQING